MISLEIMNALVVVGSAAKTARPAHSAPHLVLLSPELCHAVTQTLAIMAGLAFRTRTPLIAYVLCGIVEIVVKPVYGITMCHRYNPLRNSLAKHWHSRI